MKIFAVNPGSTSTKIGLFEDEHEIFLQTVGHEAEELAKFSEISEQLPYRLDMIRSLLRERGISLEGTDAFVGRGGGLLPVEGGTYVVDALLLRHAREGANGVRHPAQLGPQIAAQLARQYGGQAFVVNPPDVDELQDVARMTGIRGVYRTVHLHALNLKETAIRHGAKMGQRYEDSSLIVCHIGGGISVCAHRGGRMIDGFDIVGGEGPMAPTRCGGLSAAELMAFAQSHTEAEIRALCTKNGGFVSHLGTSDAQEVLARRNQGDPEAAMVWDAMLYQIGKCIGAMASVLLGRVDGILLGGGLARSEELVRRLTVMCGYIAPVYAYPGEFEMEAMAAGALRVLRGKEQAKRYSGERCWKGFTWEEKSSE